VVDKPAVGDSWWTRYPCRLGAGAAGDARSWSPARGHALVVRRADASDPAAGVV